MTATTPLHSAHIDAGARMIDFGGWDMPVHYGSQIEEHHAVRRDKGMFDVSHMTVVDLRGDTTRPFLSRLLANDIDKLKISGRALYTCMLNDAGGVIDDLIVYYLAEDWFRLVVNAATREKDLAWIERQAAPFEVRVTERPGLAMIAVQGPNARDAFIEILKPERQDKVRKLRRFSAASFGDLFVARTGYTGEDGFEVIMPEADAHWWWQSLADAGVRPCGLGARDTLRLEAGMNLYGQDMDETTHPFESGLGWTVAMKDDRDFIGRKALEQARADGVSRKLVGLVLEGRGVLRHGYGVVGGGELTSGGFSPSLERSIGMARVPVECADRCEIDIRGRAVPARVVSPPFVRDGKPCHEFD